jgi:hypothetical protein
MNRSIRISAGFSFALGVLCWVTLTTCVAIALMGNTQKAGNPWWITLLWKSVFLPAVLLRGTIGRWGEFVGVIFWHFLWAIGSGVLAVRIRGLRR